MLRANPGHAPVHLLAQRKKSPATNFFPCMSHCPGFGINFTNLRRTLVRDNRIDGICPENPVPQTLNFSEFSVPPSLPSSPEAISKSWTRNFFRTIALMEIVPKNPCHHARPALPSRSLQQLPPGPSYFHASQRSSGTRPALLSRSPRGKVT